MIRKALTSLAIAAALSSGAAPATAADRTAPPCPPDHEAPAALTETIEDRACRHGCTDERRAEVRELVRRWHWIGEWYVANRDLPEHAAWWLPAQALRESGLGRYPSGDNGASVGHFHVQPWLVRYWRKRTGRRLDRTDPYEAARALLHAVAWSYRDRVVQVCGEQPNDHMRLRLAVARVGRGPWVEPPVYGDGAGRRVLVAGRPRCTFWARWRDGQWRRSAGVTLEWALDWWQQQLADAER